MDEGVHVGGVEVVLLVPGRGRQDDVGEQRRRVHAEIDRHQQVELALALCRPRAPYDLLGLRLAPRRKVHVQYAVLSDKPVLEEVFTRSEAHTSELQYVMRVPHAALSLQPTK